MVGVAEGVGEPVPALLLPEVFVGVGVGVEL